MHAGIIALAPRTYAQNVPVEHWRIDDILCLGISYLSVRIRSVGAPVPVIALDPHLVDVHGALLAALGGPELCKSAFGGWTK